MSKRYCIFSAQYLPHMGGVERYTYNIAKGLSDNGDKVTIVTNNTMQSRCYEEKKGIKVYRFPCYPLINGRFPVMKINKEFRKINHALKRECFDAVIINARFYIHSLYAARYAKKRGIPCICIEHGTSHLSVHNPILDKVGAIYEHFHTMILKHYCKNYYGVSEACSQWSEHFHIKSKGVLYNAVDLEEIERLKREQKRDFRKEYQIAEDELVIAFTGRLLKEKGIYELVETVERLNQNEKKVHLMLAGDGDEWEYVKKHASQYIHPLGRIDFSEIIALLTQSDIFCLPSFSEGFSTSALEAAACNCYIITTRRGGTKELIIQKEYGIVMDDNSTENIYQALRYAVTHESERKKACDLCYQRLKDNFTWEKTVEKIRTEVY